MFFSLQVPESTVNFIYVLNIEIVIFLNFKGSALNQQRVLV